MESFVTQLFSTSFFLFIVTLILICTRPLLKRLFRAEFRLKVDLLILFRALIFFPISVHFFTSMPKLKSSVQAVAETTELVVYAVVRNFHHESFYTDQWLCLFLFLFIGGGIIFVVFFLCDFLNAKHIQKLSLDLCKYSNKERAAMILNIVDQLAEELHITGNLRVCASRVLTSPGIMVGHKEIRLYIPYILLEDELFDDKMFGFILRHEFFHYLHRDYLLDLLIRVVTAINWYNPMAYLLARIVREEIEQVRDNEALENQGNHERKLFNLALARIAEKNEMTRKSLSMANFISQKSVLWSRVQNIYDQRPADFHSKVYPIFVIVVIASIVLNFNSFFELQLVSSDVPIDEKQISEIMLTGKVPFSLPIHNPSKVQIPDWISRHPDRTVNSLIFPVDANTSVYAPITGKIIFAGYSDDANKGYSIVIQNEQLIVTVSHITSVGLQASDTVNQNDLIGKAALNGKSLMSSCELLVVDVTGNPINLSSILVDDFLLNNNSI